MRDTALIPLWACEEFIDIPGVGDSPPAFLIGMLGSVSRLFTLAEAIEKSAVALKAIADSLQHLSWLSLFPSMLEC